MPHPDAQRDLPPAGEAPRRPTPAVGVICLRAPDQVLLIRRGQPPRAGEWSLPGGRLEWGEPLATAAHRELFEETGVEARMLGLVDVVDGLFAGDANGAVERHYVLVDYAMRWLAGTPRAGDDATDARFFRRSDLPGLGLWAETLRVIDAAFAMWPPGPDGDLPR